MLNNELNIGFMEVSMARYLMNKWDIDKLQFLDLDAKYHILKFIRICYDRFNGMGDDGVVEEIEDYIRLQGGELGGN